MKKPLNSRALRAVCTACASAAAVLLLGGSALAQDTTVTDSDHASPPAAEQPSERPATTLGLSTMRMRGYGDVGFGQPLQEKLPNGGLQNGKRSFQIADLHLFVTAKLSDDWNVLSELLITSDFSNEASAELDRLVIQYNPSKYLRVGMGKFNGAVGYYPNQFHRAKFYQTATGRPLMFSDEDNGGILPVHQVGITVQGEIPSGPLGLHYIGEISNGRSFSETSAEVQNWSDGNNGKAINAGLFVRPDHVVGLEAGFTVYHDKLEPDALGSVPERIWAAHVVYITPSFELLNEVAVLTHELESNDTTATSKAFYTQLSHRFGIVRPYVRYEYQDVPVTDPVFGVGDVVIATGVRKAVSGGLNFGIHDFAVIKVQFDRALQYGVWANGAHFQLAFAF
jgi:hypothetical protein